MVHSSTNVKLAKAAGGAGQVHRLTDIDTEEVSLVDRAANKKKFLVIKAEGGEIGETMATEVQSNGKGGFTTARKGKAKTQKKLEVPPGYKEMASPLLTKASEMLEVLASDLNSSSAADVGDDGTIPGVPADFTGALSQVCSLLDKVGTMMPTSAAEPEEGDGAPEEGDTPTEMQMRAAADNFAKIFGGKVEKAAVLKVGAKMAKERFTQLQAAYQTLGNLIQQLAPAAAPPAGGPPAIGKAKDDEEEKKKKAAKSEPTEMSPELMKTLGQLTHAVGQIAGVVKTQGAELAALRKSRMGGTSAVVEDSPAAEGKPFSWPMDMSNPVTRETVGKNEGFFDD